VDEWNFLTIALRELSRGHEFRALADYHVAPTYVPDLVEATLDLVIDGAGGIWHLANQGAVTWHEFARLGAVAAGLDASRLVPITRAEAALPAARPAWSVLGTARARLLGPVENAICQYLAARAWPMSAERADGARADGTHAEPVRADAVPAGACVDTARAGTHDADAESALPARRAPHALSLPA
jgi:hypothetical protein